MDGFFGTKEAKALNQRRVSLTPRECTEIDILIGSRLRQIREFEGFSLKQIGKLLGISYQQFQKYETGANRITVSRLIEFCCAMNVSIQSVLVELPPAWSV